jgi:biotin operon repressor
MDAPLAQITEAIKDRVAELGIDILVIDSAGVACEGSPSDAEAANGVWQALRALPRVTPILIGHNNKAGDDRWPLGSIVWHNGCRASWFISTPGEDVGGSFALTLTKKKWNLKGTEASEQYEYVVTTDPAVSRTSVTRRTVQQLKPPVGLRIISLLKEAPRRELSRDALREALDDCSPEAVKKAVQRLRDDGQVEADDRDVRLALSRVH